MAAPVLLAAFVAASIVVPAAAAAPPEPAAPPRATLAELVGGFRDRAKLLESTSGMRLGFQSLTATFRLPPDGVRYADFVIVRLLFEATRDAGFWNLHWTITDREPNSDNIWRQWQAVQKPAFTTPTAAAECDELSALYAFLARSLGIKGVGLLWPTSNHTVAAWEIHPASGPAVRVVVPTTQIFLTEADFFATRKFDPWHQRSIYEYTRRDVLPAFELSRPLVSFFLGQAERYGGATDVTLQQLRYLRASVFARRLSPGQAALEALRLSRALASGYPEDIAALVGFAQEMRTASLNL